MGREFELKYSATPAQQETIAAAFSDFAVTSMETTYYDAPDGGLSARHITLRCRKENGVSVCTVKTPTAGLGRGEWETEEETIENAIPVLCKLGAPENIASLTAGGIIPVCGARFTRRAVTVTEPDCTLELALDRGVLLGGGQEIPLCEVEVELKSGSEEAAQRYATLLAQLYGLQPEHRSKFRRALALAKGERL